MERQEISAAIASGKTFLGIELGSTRIKAVLTGIDHTPIASGAYSWENRLENGIWTYHLDDVKQGVQSCFRALKKEVSEKYGTELVSTGAMGVSAMMHGYLVSDGEDRQLAPFRTWRNTCTEQAAKALTEQFGFNIPQRWSIAHLYQAMLNREEHIPQIAFMTTLAGYVHWQLTGRKVLGVGDASGVFPISGNRYDEKMLARFNNLAQQSGYTVILEDILPQILTAGENAGCLTEKGAEFLDPDGTFRAGVPLCPPEGDAGTGMVATNSISERTGNVSAGTSVLAMIVMEKPLESVYPEIDIVTTPTGKPVAMVHCNNCSSDIDAWAGLFSQLAKAAGKDLSFGETLNIMFEAALKADKDCGGLVSCNYLSGEPVTGLEAGVPLFMRKPDADFSFNNFCRSLLYSAIATLKIGMDILQQENVRIDSLLGHGGYFKAAGAGQKALAAALETPVSVMETAGEGGPWGMALLAAYMLKRQGNESLDSYLSEKVFANSKSSTITPAPDDCQGFKEYMKLYKTCLAAERAAVREL